MWHACWVGRSALSNVHAAPLRGAAARRHLGPIGSEPFCVHAFSQAFARPFGCLAPTKYNGIAAPQGFFGGSGAVPQVPPRYTGYLIENSKIRESYQVC